MEGVCSKLHPLFDHGFFQIGQLARPHSFEPHHECDLTHNEAERRQRVSTLNRSGLGFGSHGPSGTSTSRRVDSCQMT